MNINKLIIRCLHGSQCLNKTNKYLNREVRIMTKILTGKKKSKKGWYINNEDGASLSHGSPFVNTKNPGKSSQRRVAVLNKLFMRNITDLMSLDENIVGKNIEISEVKVTSDFQRVNVYWIPKGENDDEIQDILDKSAYSIRHELSQLRLMGEVPKINFLKDKFHARTCEIENILKNLVFDDELNENLENNEENDVNSFNQLPEMKNDIFGLNQIEIMEKITKNMKKSNLAWEKYEMKNKLNS